MKKLPVITVALAIALMILAGSASATPVNMTLSPIVTDYGWDEPWKLDNPVDFVSWTYDLGLANNFNFERAWLSLKLKDDGDAIAEYALLFGGGVASFWEVDTGVYEFDIAPNYLADVSFNLVSLGDFKVKWANLSVEGSTAAPVPEPATLILLGTGLISVIGMSAKRKRTA